MKPITLESVDIVIKRIADNEFKITMGDLEVLTDNFTMDIGDTVTINIPSVIVIRDEHGNRLVNIC